MWMNKCFKWKTLIFLSWGIIVIPTYHINDMTLKVWEKCTFTCLLYAIAVHALRTGNIWTTYDKGSLLLGTCWFSHSISPSIELPAVNSMGLPCALIFSIGALVNIRVSITILVKEFGPPGLAPRYCYRECGTKGLARRVWYQDVGTTMMQLKHQYGYFCTQIIGPTLLCQVLNTKSLVTRM